MLQFTGSESKLLLSASLTCAVGTWLLCSGASDLPKTDQILADPKGKHLLTFSDTGVSVPSPSPSLGQV